MKCDFCEYDGNTAFFEEHFTCDCCDNIMTITYHNCPSCHLMWKRCNGQPVINSIMDVSGLDIDLADEDNLMYSKPLKHSPAKNMKDLIVRCVRCDSIAYEVEDGTYECSECGFSWEVVDCG